MSTFRSSNLLGVVGLGLLLPALLVMAACRSSAPASQPGQVPAAAVQDVTVGPGKIAFASNRDGNAEIYAINADGSSQTRLTNNTDEDGFPRWSPDGARIAFQSSRDGNWEIYVMNADGSKQVRLTINSDPDILPAWSPDGARIAYVSRTGEGSEEIYVMDVDGSDQVRLSPNPPKDTDGRREESGRGVRELQGK